MFVQKPRGLPVEIFVCITCQLHPKQLLDMYKYIEMQVMVAALVGVVEHKYIRALVFFLEWYMKCCRLRRFSQVDLNEIRMLASRQVLLSLCPIKTEGTLSLADVTIFGLCAWQECSNTHACEGRFRESFLM
jgi:hypothetical protein